MTNIEAVLMMAGIFVALSIYTWAISSVVDHIARRRAYLRIMDIGHDPGFSFPED